MTNVLIPTKPDDCHAVYVKLALEKKGHSASLWYTADFPEMQRHSFALADGEILWNVNGVEIDVKNNDQYDVVWLRRPRKPILPEYIHPDDRENAQNENSEFFKTVWQAVAPNACWVNPVNRSTYINSKLMQLKVASEVGFYVPDSLFSNDPDKIKAFIRSYGENEVIYKPLCPVYWLNTDDARVTYTKEINLELLPSDMILQSTPGIYQRKIEKDFELRVTYFGDKFIAVKLNSQIHPKGRMDWRFIPGHELTVELFDLPAEMDLKCRAFMKKFGVVFGCFDFIVTPDNEYCFLEINEQGQFLWIEEINPEIKMLEPFVNFLIESSGENLDLSDDPVSISDFRCELNLILDNAKVMHKDVGLQLH